MRLLRQIEHVKVGCAGALLAVFLVAPDANASIETVLDWYASRSIKSKKNWLIGDDTCAHGSEDCNRCAPDVQQQWADMAAGALSWRERTWAFVWDSTEQPSGLSPDQTWDAGLFEEYTYHTQGFVRTNSSSVKYAMSHSDDDYGSLTFITSAYDVRAMHRTFTNHPSSIFTLGHYVGMADGTDVMRFFDVRRSLESHAISYVMSPQTAAGGPGVRTANGGLAIAKLYRGGYIVIVGQGGTSNLSQETYFYFTDGPLTAPRKMQYLATVPYSGPAGFGQSENLSIITECNTGQLYTVHISGYDGLEGNGWYRLSKVTWGDTGPGLQHVNTKQVNQHSEYCHHRSAASASVRDNGYLDLYCHERAADDNDPLGDSDEWEFREGLNYHNW